MGSYTQVKLRVTLKKETPQRVLDGIGWLIYSGMDAFKPDKHPLFQCSRASVMLNTNRSFDSWEPPTTSPGSDEGTIVFTCHSDVKNYDSEWQKLLDYLSPWVEAQEDVPLGSFQPETRDKPSPIVFRKGNLRILPDG